MSAADRLNRINIVCLGVRDIKKSLTFYRNIGFQTFEGDHAPPVVFFNNQGSKLELYPLASLVEDIDELNPPPISMPAQPSRAFNGIMLACVVKTPKEVDLILHKVGKHGGRIAKKPLESFEGGYSGCFQDPDGYYWEVGYAQAWEFDKDDMLLVDKLWR